MQTERVQRVLPSVLSLTWAGVSTIAVANQLIVWTAPEQEPVGPDGQRPTLWLILVAPDAAARLAVLAGCPCIRLVVSNFLNVYYISMKSWPILYGKFQDGWRLLGHAVWVIGLVSGVHLERETRLFSWERRWPVGVRGGAYHRQENKCKKWGIKFRNSQEIFWTLS